MSNVNPDKDNEKGDDWKVYVWLAYRLIAVVTFFVWIGCGAKSASVPQAFVGVFLSGLWPFLWIYVMVRKLTDSNYKFCKPNVVSKSP